MGSLYSFLSNYKTPQEHAQLIERVNQIFRNMANNISTDPGLVRQINEAGSELNLKYKKSMAAGASLLAIGFAGVVFGDIVREAYDSDFAETTARAVSGVATAGGLAHLIRSFSLFSDLKDYLPEGNKYSLMSMNTPEKPM